MKAMEVIMKVIVVRRKSLIVVLQAMEKWMIKVAMNLIIQIMKMLIKINELDLKKLFVFAVLIRTLVK